MTKYSWTPRTWVPENREMKYTKIQIVLSAFYCLSLLVLLFALLYASLWGLGKFLMWIVK